MRRHLVLLAFLGLGLVIALARADGDNDKDVNPVKKIMRAQKKANKAAYQAVQKKKQATLRKAAKALAEAGKPLADTLPDDVTSKEDKEAWTKLAKDLADKVQKLVDAAGKDGGGDDWWGAVTAASDAVGDSCKACHDKFRQEDEDK